MSSLNAKNRLVKPFVPNSKIIFTLPLGGKIRRGAVILQGNVNVTGGTTSGTLFKEGGPLELISRIIVTATSAGGSRYPGGKIVDSDTRSLIRNSVWNRSGKFLGDLGGSTMSAGAVANSAIYCPVPIYWADTVQRNQLNTALNTDPGVYASVQVEVDTASLSNCFTGNDRTVDYSGLTVQWVDERVAISGDTVVLYQESHETLIAATNKRMLDEAMPQDGSFLSWQLCAQTTSARTLTDAILNRIVTAGPALDFDKYALDIREAMIADEWMDPSQTATGMYFIDWTDGVAQFNSVPASSLQTYFDVNLVSTANNDALDIFTRRIVSPVAANS